MRYTKEQIDQHFKQLPEEVQDAILSTQTSAAIQDIGETHDLHIDVVGALNQEIVYVLVGLETAERFRDNVAKYVNVPEEKRGEIVKEVNERIFKPIREEMKKAPEETPEQGSTGGDEEGAEQPPSPATPVREEHQEVAVKKEPGAQSAAPQEPAPTTPQQSQTEVPTPKRPSFANKLKERTAMRAQESEVGRKQAAADAQEGQPQYRTSDPYREPIEEADLNKPTDGVQ